MSQSKAQLTNPFGTVNITDGVNVSGVITATTLIGDGTALTGIALTGNINTSGIITASEFYGYGGGLDNVGLGTESSINTTGIITASAFYGDGSGLTGVGGDLTVLSFSPTNGATSVAVASNIVITFNKSIQAGSGTITLRSGAADGTIVESYDVSSSDRLTFNAGTLTIDPTDNLSGLTTYYTVLPAGVVKDAYNQSENSLIDTYSFTTIEPNYELWMWGWSATGILGLNDLLDRSSPTQIPGTQWSEDELHVNYRFGAATKSDNTLWVWGYNAYGGLGQNDRTQYSSPIQIPGTQWNTLGGGNHFLTATKTDGTLWAWGFGGNGNIGDNSAINRSSPTQIPGTQWARAFPNGYTGYFGIASKTDGTLWAWGSNGNGQLGQNNITYYSSPIQIPGTQWNTTNKYTISGDGYGFRAIKTDGTLWSWGYNGAGKLGHNNTVNYSSPQQVPGTQWSKVAAVLVTAATKTDGTLWVWGSGTDGGLGQNDSNIPRSSPVQVPGTQWDTPYASYYVSGGVKTDGTLWLSGTNGRGAIGQNDRTYYSSPRQIPGTQWYGNMAGTVYAVAAIKQTT